MLERTVIERFGGDTTLALSNGRTVNVSEAIRSAGPGQGFTMVPWALDHYEKVLRLAPGETWLLKRLLKHAWEFDSVVFVSHRKITFEANIARNTLRKYTRRLCDLSYLRLVSQGNGYDRRNRFSTEGLFAALALCVVADRASDWAQTNGGPVHPNVVRSFEYSGTRCRAARGVRFDLDFDALEALSQRTREADDDDTES